MSNPFACWGPGDVARHNARVQGAPTSEGDQEMARGSERDLHDQIFNECRRRGWIPFHGSMSERTHRTLGEPDFQIYMDAGNSMLVECKTATGKLTKEQQATIAHLKKLDHEVHVVRSFQEFLNLL